MNQVFIKQQICCKLRFWITFSARIAILFLPILTITSAISLTCIPSNIYAETISSVPSLEFRVKAAFLYNFSRYVEWQASSQTRLNTKTFNLCVVGDNNDAYPALQENVSKEVHGRPISILNVQDGSKNDSFAMCDVLYIQGNWRKISHAKLEEIEKTGILTVSDEPGFAIINFLIVDDRVKFEIIQQRAEKANLSISSHLLRLAVSQ